MTKPLLSLVPRAATSAADRDLPLARKRPRVSPDLHARAARAIEETKLLVERARSQRQRSSTNQRHMLDFIAHDLVNHLGAAQLSLTALEQDWAAQRPGEPPESLRLLQRSLVHMGYLVADLRDARQIQLGRFVLSPDAAVRPATLVSAAVDAAKGYAGGRNFKVACAPRLPAARVDEQRIQRVFANLIGNAVKYTDLDGHISVGARPAPTADEVMFFVRDDGEGMTKNEQLRIFEPYWRGQHGVRAGTGLGLPISRGIVEAHGGRMFVASRENVGSTFSFTLPVASPRWGPRRAGDRSQP